MSDPQNLETTPEREQTNDEVPTPSRRAAAIEAAYILEAVRK